MEVQTCLHSQQAQCTAADERAAALEAEKAACQVGFLLT